jgi:hypothetical protein
VCWSGSEAHIRPSGDEGQLGSLFSVLQPGDPSFNIIEP